MLKAFTTYIDHENLFTVKDKILLAVSGGLDSVVLTDLFHQAGFSFGIAHVNFTLRGKESDEDESFVKSLAKNYNVPLYANTFETLAYAKENGLSTQMAARDLRYDFFEKIRIQNDYQYIAVAHHKDDQIETFFINLLRGTGISGLRGMLPKQNKIIRPLLFTERKKILRYLQEKDLKFREDSSNQSVKYLRNKIRHNLAPVLYDLDSNFLDTMHSNMQRIGDAEQIYKQHIANIRHDLQHKKNNKFYFSIPKIQQLNPCVTYVYELLKDFEFSFSMAEDIVRSLNNEPGKLFTSESHELIKDREFLIVRKKIKIRNETPITIDENQKTLEEPINLTFQHIKRTADFNISQENHMACLDYSKLKFPLYIRKWKRGDYFFPLGSSYKKKLSDYFIDKKLNLFEKEDIYLLYSETNIVWIIGQQIDDRFKITSQTKNIYKIVQSMSS